MKGKDSNMDTICPLQTQLKWKYTEIDHTEKPNLLNTIQEYFPQLLVRKLRTTELKNVELPRRSLVLQPSSLRNNSDAV